jgi:hypothetical protein
MRNLTDHIVENDAVNHQPDISVIDAPGADGANHEYQIEARTHVKSLAAHRISFQNGPIPENGVSGVTQEALLAIIIDRLRSFQAGMSSSRENSIALIHCEEALMWLQRRTRARIRRGVEGTHKI